MEAASILRAAFSTRRCPIDRTSGYCHICHRKLAFTKYGIVGAKGACEVEHSRPQALGGTHHSNNKYAACISCNREKSLATPLERCARETAGSVRP